MGVSNSGGFISVAVRPFCKNVPISGSRAVRVVVTLEVEIVDVGVEEILVFVVMVVITDEVVEVIVSEVVGEVDKDVAIMVGDKLVVLAVVFDANFSHELKRIENTLKIVIVKNSLGFIGH